MHILLIHQAFTTIDEAGGTRHAELCSYLAEHGHKVTVIASPVSYLSGTAASGRQKWIGREQASPNLTILRAYTYPALHRSFFHRGVAFVSFMLSSLAAGMGVKNVDLVWGTSPPIFQGATAWLLSRLKKAPLLFEVRDLWPAFAVELGVLRSPALIAASTWLERFLYRQASRVIVNSPGFVEHVQQGGAKRVDLVPNGADPAMFDPLNTGADFRREHGLDDSFVVLYAGAHGMANDLETLLGAADCLKDQPGIRFVLVGDGKQKPALQAEAVRRELERVLFLPPVSKAGMREVLAGSDACVAILKPIPLFRTTYPNKVFDYMAAGKPVVLAIDGVIRQAVEDAGAGIAVPPGDPPALAEAIRHLAAGPALAREMGAAGRQAVTDRYSRRAIAVELMGIMEEMRTRHG